MLTHAQRTLAEERVVRGGEHLGEAARLGPRQCVGSGRRHTLVRQRKLGLPTAADERHDAIADREAFDVTAERNDLTGELHARNVRWAPGRRRVQPASLRHVCTVEAGRAHVDEQLARARLGIGMLPPLQPALGHGHRPHGATLGRRAL